MVERENLKAYLMIEERLNKTILEDFLLACLFILKSLTEWFTRMTCLKSNLTLQTVDSVG